MVDFRIISQSGKSPLCAPSFLTRIITKYRIMRTSFGNGLGPVVPMSESKGEWRKANIGGRFKYDIATIENRSALERMTFIAGHGTSVGRVRPFNNAFSSVDYDSRRSLTN